MVIVGHGASILRRPMGAVIDSARVVVRLKDAPRLDPQHWGTRTDVICARRPHWLGATLREDVDYWLFDSPSIAGPVYADVKRWEAWYRDFSTRKPSTGLCAVMCAVELLRPKNLAVVGFDAVTSGKQSHGGKWTGTGPWLAHDAEAEKRALHALGVEIVNLDAD